MNTRFTSTLAVTIAMLLAGSMAAADERATVDDNIGNLGVTMQVLDDDSSEPMHLLTLPDAANSDEALSASDEGKAHTQALADHSPDANENDDDHGNDPADPEANDHGKTVSELAQGLKAEHDDADSGKAFAATVRETVASAASDNAAEAASDAADAAAEAAEHAAEASAEAAENAADAAADAADAAAEAAENAAEASAEATEDAADAAADAAENAAEAAADAADNAADSADLI